MKRGVRILMWIGIAVVGLAVIGTGVVVIGMARLSANQPTTDEMPLGLSGGELTPCPDSPNCVSTQAPPSDEVHYVPPIPYEGSRVNVKSTIVSWIEEREDAEIVTEREDYVHAVFSSQVFGFNDDLELYFPPAGDVVQLRSASRVGQGDMGVNRARYQAVRAAIAGEE